MAPSSSRVLAFLLSPRHDHGWRRRVGVICSYSFHTTQLPGGGVGTCGGVRGNMLLFGASVRLNPDYYPLLPEKISLSVVRDSLLAQVGQRPPQALHPGVKTRFLCIVNWAQEGRTCEPVQSLPLLWISSENACKDFFGL